MTQSNQVTDIWLWALSFVTSWVKTVQPRNFTQMSLHQVADLPLPVSPYLTFIQLGHPNPDINLVAKSHFCHPVFPPAHPTPHARWLLTPFHAGGVPKTFNQMQLNISILRTAGHCTASTSCFAHLFYKAHQFQPDEGQTPALTH